MKIRTFSVEEVLLKSARVLSTPLLPGGTMKCMLRATQSSTILKYLSAITVLYLGIMSKILILV